MKKTFFMRGSGGQGVQVVGMMLLHTVEELGGYATFYPEYGASKRGGFSQCAVMTSDEPIRSFTAQAFDVTVVLNEDSYEKFGGAVKPGGVLIYNSSLIARVAPAEGITVLGVPFDELARELGSQKVMNTLVYGFLMAYTGLMGIDGARRVVEEAIGGRESLRELNEAALERGFAEAEKYTAKK